LRTLGLLRQRRPGLSRPESPVHRLRLGCRHRARQGRAGIGVGRTPFLALCAGLAPGMPGPPAAPYPRFIGGGCYTSRGEPPPAGVPRGSGMWLIANEVPPMGKAGNAGMKGPDWHGGEANSAANLSFPRRDVGDCGLIRRGWRSGAIASTGAQRKWGEPRCVSTGARRDGPRRVRGLGREARPAKQTLS
jgi:hypothetical protein